VSIKRRIIKVLKIGIEFVGSIEVPEIKMCRTVSSSANGLLPTIREVHTLIAP